MEEIRDCKGHLACIGDAKTGLIGIKTKDRKATIQLPVGYTIKIERRDTITTITRISISAFKIESHTNAA